MEYITWIAIPNVKPNKNIHDVHQNTKDSLLRCVAKAWQLARNSAP